MNFHRVMAAERATAWRGEEAQMATMSGRFMSYSCSKANARNSVYPLWDVGNAAGHTGYETGDETSAARQ